MTTAYLKTLDTMVVDGKTYYLLFYDSLVYHAYDSELPILVDKQHTSYHTDRPPTTETVLARSLRVGTLQLPELLWRPFDCHLDSFTEWQHQSCVVQMLHKSLARRTWTGRADKPGVKRENSRLPIPTVNRIMEELDICFEQCNFKVAEFPFEEDRPSWREAGIPSTMIIRFCERQTENYESPTSCSIFHNVLHHIVFAAQESHCFF